MNEIIGLVIAGACGALVKDIIKDNAISLPKCADGKIMLGCIGGMIVGSAVGFLVDQNPITAFFSGYAGSAMLISLMPVEARKK